jgi:hypothetical protein
MMLIRAEWWIWGSLYHSIVLLLADDTAIRSSLYASVQQRIVPTGSFCAEEDGMGPNVAALFFAIEP